MGKMFEENKFSRISLNKLPIRGVVRGKETSHSPIEGKKFYLLLSKERKLKRIKVVIRRLKANKARIEQDTSNS